MDVPEIAPIELNPAFAAVIEAFTYAVVANVVELSFVAGVGAVGTPVNAGEAKSAFVPNVVFIVAIELVLLVILEVFAFTLEVNEVILEVFEFTLVGKVAIVA